MGQQKRVTVSAKITYHEDAELIAWWNSIPRGSRSAVMKDMMQEYLERNQGGYRPIMPRNIPQPFDPKRFSQVCEDAAWIRTALADLPGYVERVIRQVAAAGGGQLSNGHAPSVLPNGDVSDEAAVRREARMKKAKW
jgi:hypothetical protein